MSGASGAPQQERAFTAQVVLRAAGRASEAEPTTSDNLAEALPDPTAARRAQAFFERAGFEVGEVVGASFSLVGPLRAFVAAFGRDASELEPILGGTTGGGELDLSHLPDDLRDTVEAVIVTPRPAFGPWNP